MTISAAMNPIRLKWLRLLIATFLIPLLIGESKANEDAVPLFEGLVAASAKATRSVEHVYFNRHTQLWAKRTYDLRDVKYDVKQTSSLITPIIGVAKLDVISRQSASFGTEAEAAAAIDMDQRLGFIYEIELRYTYKQGKWRLLSGHYFATMRAMNHRSGPFDVSEESVLRDPDSMPHDIVVMWLPK